MDGLAQLWNAADGVGRGTALLLLAMSIAAWVLIVWKTWVLRRAAADLARALPAFWDAPSRADGRARLQALDRERLLLPLLDAAEAEPAAATLQAAARPESQRTRRLRDALQAAHVQLQSGQVVLASIGATAPFVGLFGTVWGIYHALVGLVGVGQVSLDQVSGPVGEALVMTAAGIAVAVPAVLAYNLFGSWIAECQAQLEGYAHDLLDL
ncbi:MAG: MotA/TolQ/ExbB proton channel family protein [Ideonella sp. WA131b]|jgi:biopolymer transport protein ExbB|nr:MotA/TolQ/ExbB proton channel family protein [Ideonella sp. WA131b]